MPANDPRTCFPLYLLPNGRRWQVLISPGRRDMTHPTLWRLCGARILADRLGLDHRELAEMPYACHRARVVGSTVFWGGDLTDAQRQAVMTTLNLLGLSWRLDEHEVRQELDVSRLQELSGQAQRRRKSRGDTT